MSESSYKPWREDHEPVDLLAAEASETWAALLSESRRCVDALKEVTREADDRLLLGQNLMNAMASQPFSIHAKLLERLERFESRLNAMETRLTELEIESIEHRPFPLHTPNRHAA